MLIFTFGLLKIGSGNFIFAHKYGSSRLAGVAVWLKLVVAVVLKLGVVVWLNGLVTVVLNGLVVDGNGLVVVLFAVEVKNGLFVVAGVDVVKNGLEDVDVFGNGLEDAPTVEVGLNPPEVVADVFQNDVPAVFELFPYVVADVDGNGLLLNLVPTEVNPPVELGNPPVELPPIPIEDVEIPVDKLPGFLPIS